MIWHDVKAWCLGENDTFGTCYWAFWGNDLALRTGEVMSDGEIENAARVMEGFSPFDPTTDHGEILDAGNAYILANGWPGDFELKPERIDPVAVTNIVEAVRTYKCVQAALALPEDQDFTDTALTKDGVSGHCVAVVDATPDKVIFISWAQPQEVSMAWWLRFARQCNGPVWKSVDVANT